MTQTSPRNRLIETHNSTEYFGWRHGPADRLRALQQEQHPVGGPVLATAGTLARSAPPSRDPSRGGGANSPPADPRSLPLPTRQSCLPRPSVFVHCALPPGHPSPSLYDQYQSIVFLLSQTFSYARVPRRRQPHSTGRLTPLSAPKHPQ